MFLCLPTHVHVHVHFNIKCQGSLFTFMVKYFLLYTINNCFIGKHFEPSTTSLSQASEMDRGGGPCKRSSSFRFTEYQLCELKKRFKSDPHIKGIEKQLMAKNLGITVSSLANWFKVQRRLDRNLATEVSNATIGTA